MNCLQDYLTAFLPEIVDIIVEYDGDPFRVEYLKRRREELIKEYDLKIKNAIQNETIHKTQEKIDKARRRIKLNLPIVNAEMAYQQYVDVATVSADPMTEEMRRDYIKLAMSMNQPFYDMLKTKYDWTHALQQGPFPFNYNEAFVPAWYYCDDINIKYDYQFVYQTLERKYKERASKAEQIKIIESTKSWTLNDLITEHLLVYIPAGEGTYTIPLDKFLTHISNPKDIPIKLKKDYMGRYDWIVSVDKIREQFVI